MAVLEIPITPGVGCFREKVVLNGVAFNLRFAWNTRAARWFMDIEDSAGAQLLVGQELELGWPVLARYRGTIAGLPAGEFLPYNEYAADQPLSLENFGVDGKLLYVEAAP